MLNGIQQIRVSQFILIQKLINKLCKYGNYNIYLGICILNTYSGEWISYMK